MDEAALEWVQVLGNQAFNFASLTLKNWQQIGD
jgi:hypothetical protein